MYLQSERYGVLPLQAKVCLMLLLVQSSRAPRSTPASDQRPLNVCNKFDIAQHSIHSLFPHDQSIVRPIPIPYNPKTPSRPIKKNSMANLQTPLPHLTSNHTKHLSHNSPNPTAHYSPVQPYTSSAHLKSPSDVETALHPGTAILNHESLRFFPFGLQRHHRRQDCLTDS